MEEKTYGLTDEVLMDVGVTVAEGPRSQIIQEEQRKDMANVASLAGKVY